MGFTPLEAIVPLGMTVGPLEAIVRDYIREYSNARGWMPRRMYVFGYYFANFRSMDTIVHPHGLITIHWVGSREVVEKIQEWDLCA